MDVLDYRESFLTERDESGLDSPSRPLVLSEQGFCPYCKTEASVVHNTGDKYAVPDLYEGYSSPRTTTWYAKAWLCQCGWWEVESIQKHTMEPWNRAIYRAQQASLKRFNLSSAEIPLEELRIYLTRNPKILNDLEPKRMELLTQSVFRDFYNCEVIHCGRSHDKGIDLVLVDSDFPVAVQVKRRGERAPSEAVTLVREFLGAAFVLEGFRKGIIVTTAHDFSREAWKAAKLAITRDFVDSFELVNGGEFLRRLKLVTDSDPGHWKPFVDFRLQQECSI